MGQGIFMADTEMFPGCSANFHPTRIRKTERRTNWRKGINKSGELGAREKVYS